MEPQPPKWQFLNKDESEELMKFYSDRQLGWCLVGDNKYFLPYAYATHGESIWRIQVRPSDRWIVTFPRSGTIVESMKPPRFMKTHLSLELLPPGLLDAECKVIYVARNPMDVAVSTYYAHVSREVITFTGDFTSYWNLFVTDRKIFCPYRAHVKKAWSLRHHPNLLFLFYEEMKMDLPDVIRRVAQFYGRPCTDDEVTKLARHLDFESFKNNPMICSSKFNVHDCIPKDVLVRKGQVGGWKELFTPELAAQADKWIKENLADTDLVFPHM